MAPKPEENDMKEPLLSGDKDVKDKKEDKTTPEGSCMYRLACKIWGHIPPEEFEKVMWFAFILFTIISGYWLLRSLKDSIVIAINGREAIPKMKMTSLIVVFVLVTLYNKLYDMFPKHQLFYIICGFYFIVFSVIGYLLTDEEIGLPNKEVSQSRLLGWVSYCSIESFGSIVISLFWGFANSSMSLKGAKSCYGLIIAISQIGAVMGPTVVSQAKHLGVPLCYTIGACHMVTVIFLIFLFTLKFGMHKDDIKAKDAPPKKKAGALEGILIFIKYGYIRGLFCISCLYYVQETVLDYTLKSLADEKFKAEFPDDPKAATAHLASFMGAFGQRANAITFVLSLLGTSMIINRLGVRLSVLVFPTFTIAGMVWVYFKPELWVVYVVVIGMKAGCYFINNPVKEILYQPTSTVCKFKAKSWIDVFGGRGCKAAGAAIANGYSDIGLLVSQGGLYAGGVSAFLFVAAVWTGSQFDKLVKSGIKIGEEISETLPQVAKTEDKDATSKYN